MQLRHDENKKGIKTIAQIEIEIQKGQKMMMERIQKLENEIKGLKEVPIKANKVVVETREIAEAPERPVLEDQNNQKVEKLGDLDGLEEVKQRINDIQDKLDARQLGGGHDRKLNVWFENHIIQCNWLI